LSELERRCQSPEAKAEAIRELPVLLKRVAIAGYSRATVASLMGEEWLAFLDRTGGTKEFTEGSGRMLPEILYASIESLKTLPDERVAALRETVRRWIGRHRIVEL
jgi:hypothetical protein